MKFLNWVKQELVIDALMIEKLAWLNLFIWM